VSWRARTLAVLLPVLVALAGLTAAPVEAQDVPSTTRPIPYPTTTTRPDDGMNSTRRTTTTTSPAAAPQPADVSPSAAPGSPASAPASGAPAPGSGSSAPAPDAGPVFPPGYTAPGGTPPASNLLPGGPPGSLSPAQVQASLDYLSHAGGNNTRALLDALAPLQSIGYTEQEAAMIGMGQFPVAGFATFRDDFGEPRGNGTRTHMGNDVFAAFDTPVRAPVYGIVRYQQEDLGGNAAYVTAPDGTYYYMAHLNAFAPDLASGAHVSQGQFIGLCGDTGNAKGGAPHVHFEYHPNGGAAVDPKVTLDTWLAQALAAAPALVASLTQDIPQPGAVVSTGLTRRFDDPAFSSQAAPMVGPMVWESSLNPTGSALGLSQASAVRAADAIDWDQRAATAQQQEDTWRRADQEARATLLRLTPPAVSRLLAINAG
jgi:murein DD-endopeptidase MepM/ murein hydrolase activator NlpD